jgi:hypothetical protein
MFLRLDLGHKMEEQLEMVVLLRPFATLIGSGLHRHRHDKKPRSDHA